MSLIGKILAPESIILELDVSNKKRAFEQVGLLVENRFGIARGVIYDCLFEREKLGSTGLGQGIGIPHGRVHGLKETLGIFIRLLKPIPFDAPDGKNVKFLFILLVPEEATNLHLQILSELAQCFSSRTLRENLLTANSAEEIHQLLDRSD